MCHPCSGDVPIAVGESQIASTGWSIGSWGPQRTRRNHRRFDDVSLPLSQNEHSAEVAGRLKQPLRLFETQPDAASARAGFLRGGILNLVRFERKESSLHLPPARVNAEQKPKIVQTGCHLPLLRRRSWESRL